MLALIRWTTLLPCALAFYPYPDLETSASHYAKKTSHNGNNRRDPLYMYKPTDHNAGTSNDPSLTAKLTRVPRTVS